MRRCGRGCWLGCNCCCGNRLIGRAGGSFCHWRGCNRGFRGGRSGNRLALSRGGCGSGNLGGNRRLDGYRLLDGGRVGNNSRWRLDHHSHCGRRYHHDGRTMLGSRACRSLGDDGADRRMRGNGGRSRWRDDNGRRGARLGKDLARLRTSRCGGGRRGNCHHHRRRRTSRRLRDYWRRGPLRQTALPRLGFLFLLFGQNGLQHVARLGDMRQVNFGRNALLGTRCLRACLACGARAALKMRANLVGLIVLQRTGVGFAAG